MNLSMGHLYITTKPAGNPPEELKKFRVRVREAPDDAQARLQFAACLYTAASAHEAETEYLEAIRLADIESEEQSQIVAIACYQWGCLLNAQNRSTDAAAYLRRALTIHEATLPDKWPYNVQTRRVRKELKKAEA